MDARKKHFLFTNERNGKVAKDTTQKGSAKGSLSRTPEGRVRAALQDGNICVEDRGWRDACGVRWN
jgi:hypothetical protein